MQSAKSIKHSLQYTPKGNFFWCLCRKWEMSFDLQSGNNSIAIMNAYEAHVINAHRDKSHPHTKIFK